MDNDVIQGVNGWDRFREQPGIPWGNQKPAWSPVLLEMMRRLPQVGFDVGADLKRSVEMRDGAALPLPVRLYRFITESNHYHIGYFDNGSDSLKDALDRLVMRSIPHFIPSGRTLDLGCGIGGTSSLLAEHAFPCLGIDPAPEQILFASHSLAPRMNPVFAVLSFDDLFNGRNAFHGFFENIVTTEILQFFPDLDPFFLGCAKLLRAEGRLIINDFSAIPALSWERVPYHRQGRIHDAARDAGFAVESREILSGHTAPTMEKLIQGIRSRKDAIIALLEGTFPDVEQQIRNHIILWENIAGGFENGDLAYETYICRRLERIV